MESSWPPIEVLMMMWHCREGLWEEKLLKKAEFKGDLVLCQPDVTELALGDGDEFLILATDGLW